MTSRTVGAADAAYTDNRMEWMLQVVDEIDDAIGAMRHGWDGIHAGTGALWGGGVVALALWAAFIVGGWRLS